MEKNEVIKNVRPRVVVIFDNDAEYQEFEGYAKSKCLDVKNFLKFATKAYMDKYPRISERHGKAVQPYA
jgi:hypothetical protein